MDLSQSGRGCRTLQTGYPAHAASLLRNSSAGSGHGSADHSTAARSQQPPDNCDLSSCLQPGARLNHQPTRPAADQSDFGAEAMTERSWEWSVTFPTLNASFLDPFPAEQRRVVENITTCRTAFRGVHLNSAISAAIVRSLTTRAVIAIAPNAKPQPEPSGCK